MNSFSTTSSVSDSLAISYQSPALEGPLDDDEGEDPKMIRWYPNASITGDTGDMDKSFNIRKRRQGDE